MCRLTTTILEEIKNHDIFKEKDDITNNFLDLFLPKAGLFHNLNLDSLG